MRRRVFSSSGDVAASLVLEDGSVWRGAGFGAHGVALGELCFNTAMSGYQEILSDPSYADQIVVFSFPHIGNVGVNAADEESSGIKARGCVVAQRPSEPSNWRGEQDFSSWLCAQGVVGLYDVDTRSLVRLLRDGGAQRAAIVFEEKRFSLKACLKKVRAWPGLKGAELARAVSCREPYVWSDSGGNSGGNSGSNADSNSGSDSGSDPESDSGSDSGSDSEHDLGSDPSRTPLSVAPRKSRLPSVHVVALDFGMKRNILRCLSSGGARVTVVPATTSSAAIFDLHPDGIFLSNGPGDPSASTLYAQSMLKPLLSSHIPMFGICLGFQLLAHALGARSEKMSFGHHGANHPVQVLSSGQVEITSQNHGFAVPVDSLPEDVEATHVSLFDGTLEGFASKERPVFAVQYHPESSPGPHDSRHLFARFLKNCRRFQATQTTSSSSSSPAGSATASAD